ncbi:LolA family protein [Polluticoccus soli]|uniref:LolA family protein n=1 Tax=Polluticoccus soli TaxID=3034150 RepID=UPI0023E0B3A6|nr:outer membrane lipoprotein carrier protein LolA [Flavipsychrobacter sp. JY13-12]
MKKLLTVCVLALGMIAEPALAQNDAKAKTILENVSKKVNAMKSLKANFALHLAGANGKVRETKKGSFVMKGPKYKVQLAGQEIICDNKTVWTYMKETNEVQVSNYNPNEQTISPAKLFTNFYDKEYSYKYLGTRKVNGKDCDVVQLIPTSKAKQFSKVELAVDKNSTIVGGNIWEKNGNQFKYDVSGFTPNPAVADATFSFDKKQYPGVEVVDLR